MASIMGDIMFCRAKKYAAITSIPRLLYMRLTEMIESCERCEERRDQCLELME